MKKFKPQHSRLLFIDKKIRDRTYPNCTSLAEEWEVSAKTIQRDLDYMRNMLDAPMAYDAKMRGYYYTEERFQLPAIALNDSDLFAVFIAEKVLKQYENTPVYPRLRSLFAKIAESLPDKITIDPAQYNNKFTFFISPHSMIKEQVWETVFTALRTLQSLIISYAKPGEIDLAARTIDPYHVVIYQGEWYVIAFCHSRQGIRTFALSRINKAQLTEHCFTVPPDFDFHKTTRDRFGVQWSDEKYDVRIWFSPMAAPYILERRWHEGQELHENSDKSIIMSFTASHLLEVKRWVLSWGGMARILAPEILVNEIKKELELSMRNYGGIDEKRDHQSG
ncbi:MAG: WYL domain-containing protein [Desulfobulbaceae bacterium]|nr:WYL domain-containing protein [Desulfobulbaceae bacterium]